MAATAASPTLEQNSAASGTSNNSSSGGNAINGVNSVNGADNATSTPNNNNNAPSGLAAGTAPITLSRARRRPARYSPEPIVSASSSNNNSNSAGHHHNNHSNNNSGNAILHQLLHNQSMDVNGCASNGSLIQQEIAPGLLLPQPHLLSRLGREGENSEESNGALANNLMAPAAAVAPTRRTKHRTKRKSKRRPQHGQHVAEDGGKRPRVANVLLENEILIDEIRARKALWMRTHEQHHSSLLTAPLWEEIAKALDTTHENIRRRWKSLKDHYRRELKKSMTDPAAPPSTWPYYKKMRFMKSQMFVSLRRKNGEDHLEILSDDEEDINSQWNGQMHRGKVENGSDTMDDYELNPEYNEMVKYEQHMQQLNQDGEMEGQEEEEEEEEEVDEQQQQQDDQSQEQQDDQSQDQLQGQEEHQHPGTGLSGMQQQPAATSNIATMTTMVNGIPATIVTTSANLTPQQREQLASRLSAIQQQHMQQQQQQAQTHHHLGSALQRGQQQRGEIGQGEEDEEEEEEEGEPEEMNARHSRLAQQRASINSQLNDMQRRADMSALHQRANITAMHRNAEISTMQHRAEMQQQRNPGGLDGSGGVDITDDRGAISDDYHFFMSLMPHVRHFTSLQKLKVRNRIQQIIIEEASNVQQYDPLANC